MSALFKKARAESVDLGMPFTVSEPVPWSKYNSAPAACFSESRRSELAELAPEAIAELHGLHEAFVKQLSSRDADDKLEEWPSEESLDNWEADTGGRGRVQGRLPGGSWHVHGVVPPVERPLNVRELQLLPRGPRLDVEKLLKRNGMAAINMKGQKGYRDKAPGQDNVSFSHLPNGWEVVCVMDGHGLVGQWPATRACRSIPFFLKGASCSTMLRQGAVEAALIHAFSKAQNDLVMTARLQKVDLQANGCTALCALWNAEQRSLWVATAGDSRAAMLAPGRGCIAETRDHKPTDKAERKRVEEAGGEVIENMRDGYLESRVYVGGKNYPGIAMTRSLGDLVVKGSGVIAEPEVVHWEVAEGALLLAASDGVWEFMSSDEAAAMVLSALERRRSHKEACQQLVEVCRGRWAEEEGIYCDDISVVLVSLGGAKTIRRTCPRWPCAQGICNARCQVM